MRSAPVVLALCAACTFGFERELEWSDLRGTVVFVDDAQQTVLVEDAMVAIEGAALSVRSDPKGRFVLRGLPAGTHVLLVSHMGDDGVERGARLRVVIGQSTQGAGDGKDLGRIPIGRLGSLSGTVTYEGESAPDTRVVLNSRDVALTDAGGAFRHEKLLPGVYDLTAMRAVGGVVQSSEPVEIEVAPGRAVTRALVLSRIEGSALVNGVALVAGLRSHVGINVDFHASTGETYSTVTDRTGTYLDTLPVGEYLVVARTSGFVSASLPHFPLTRDSQAPTLLLVPCPETGCEEGPHLDGDDDGVFDDVDNCAAVANAGQEDQDADGVGDACDDDDADGVFDDVDNCPEASNAGQEDRDADGEGDACDDGDADGVFDEVDNCPEVANAGQDDWNQNGVGDACEDGDADGVFDDVDNCPEVANAGQADRNQNGVGDACEDGDADGVADGFDNCPEVANPGQADWNQNDVGDACEDFDGDLLVDGLDNCREASNPSQVDRDDDGRGDACDQESGLCGEDWCFEFPTPGPAAAVAVETSSTGDLWVSYRKSVASRTPQGWQSSLVIDSSFNGTFDQIGELRAMELVADDELYVGGTGGLLGHYQGGVWSVDVSSSVSSLETIHSMLGRVYAFTPYGHRRLAWPTTEDFVELDPQSVVHGVATLPSGLTFLVHNLGQPFVTTDALAFTVLDDPSLDLTHWWSGGGAFAVGLDAFLVGTGENGGIVIQITEGDSGVTYRQFDLPGLWTVDGIAGSAHDDVWVYGRQENADRPMLLHFDGVVWQRHALGVDGSSGNGDSIVGLVATSPTQAELVLSSGAHLKWDGQRWLSLDRVSQARLVSVAATGAGDAWAVDSSGGLFRWDATGWRPQPLPGSWAPSRVVAVAPNDVWALGSGGIWRFDGQSWRVQANAPVLDIYDEWYGAWASAPDDVWLWSGEVFVRFDGTNFVTVDQPGESVPALLGGAPNTEPWAVVYGALYRWSEGLQTFVSSVDVGDEFAAGSPLAMVVHGEDDVDLLGSQGERVHWDGSDWLPASSVLPSGYSASLTAVWDAQGATTYAVSSAGDLLSRDTPAGGPFALVTRLSGGYLDALSGFGDELWALGDTDVHLGPTGQSSRTSWSSATRLRRLWLSPDASEGLAMADDGATLWRTREGWVPLDMASEAWAPVTTLSGTSMSSLRGLTSTGEAVRYDGIWRVDAMAPTTFAALWARSETEFWAVTGSDVYRDTGSGWQLLHSASGTTGLNVVTGDATRVFAAGDAGVVTFDGATWGFEPTTAPLMSLAVARDTGELFALESGALDRIINRAIDGTWTTITIDAPTWNDCNRPLALGVRSSTEIWLTAPEGGGAFASKCPPFIGRFDGSAWHVDPALPPMKLYGFFETTAGLWAVGNDSAILRLRVFP